MIRTLHILPTLDPVSGGLSQAVRNMISYSSNVFLRHEVLCMDDPDDYFIRDAEFIVHAIGKGLTAWSYNRNLKSWLGKNIRSYQNIIVHGLWQYQSYAVVRAWQDLRHQRPKLYVMPHGMLDPYFQKARGRRLKAIRNLFFWEFVERRLVNNADVMLFTTHREELLARTTFRFYKPKEVLIVGLGVKMPPPEEGSYEKELEKIDIELLEKRCWLFIGRLHPKKGIDMLIMSYLQLKKNGNKLPPLVIAGPGLETGYGNILIQLAAKDPQIIFPGMLEGAAKWAIFYRAEVFILPSHQENFGIAVVEALACGVPVIISDQVNICAEIMDASAGLVGADTEQGTLQVLNKWHVLQDIHRHEFGENARKLYIDFFSEAAAAQKLICLLKSKV